MSDNTLPIHPLTGMRAIGYTRKGPIWPVLGGSEGGGHPSGDGGEGGEPDGDEPKTFTQDEVDQIIGRTRTEERRKASQKYADYDDLKATAAAKKTADERIADLEKQNAQSQANSLRLRVAGDYGISTKRGENGEPSDAELFLTGTDEETLTAQAERLAAREEERKKNQPHVSREGYNPRPKPDSTKEFLAALTGRGQ
ncbi:hypothetical protein EF294_07470 [Gordonia oryzae]|uniref:DUF4355 domain-containing protein n=1 Tax=Gordonia oryzae TaxID=2487349 RepID=A0A3N4HET7_9ACTN|nr:hypothetical protein [Gordonia oryzae]RPA64914.1 hypothetical protein EF294_07470 [Gordonia oryzae]